MKVTAYRISKAKFASSIWSGIGAREYGGRWNSKGVAVVYAAENRSLAAMEQLVHLVTPRVLEGYVIASITFDSGLAKRVDPETLPAGWNRPVAPWKLRAVGDRWVATGIYPVLVVPSVIIAGEWNYLFNPAHAAFKSFAKSRSRRFAYDSRLG